MDAEHRNLIKNNSLILAENVNIDKLRPLLLDFKIFTTSMLKDLKTEYDLFRELPTRGPDAFESFIEVLEEAGCEKAVKILTPSEKLESEEEIYEITSKPLGYCLIINNVNFTKLECRHGSDQDASALEKVFTEIGYSVEKERNMEERAMLERLEKFSKKDHSNVDSCIVVILSHGGNKHNLDVIYGTDEKYIYKKDILALFNNESCKSLNCKPKIFFFQSCRGDNRDYGVNPKDLKNETNKDCKVMSLESIDASNNICDLLPTSSDMFIVHSSLPYHVSHRHNENGSWFCQDLVYVLSKHFKEKDLETMIKKVNRKLSIRLSVSFRTKQALHMESLGLSKSIRFYVKPK